MGYGMKVKRTYYALDLLYETNEEENEVTFDEIDLEKGKCRITFSRAAYNPVGFHIGTEVFEATYKLIPKKAIEYNPMHRHEYSGWLIDIYDPEEFVCIDAPESEMCNEEHECKDECQCELYLSPRDEWEFCEDEAWQDYTSRLDRLTTLGYHWKYNPKNEIPWQIFDGRNELQNHYRIENDEDMQSFLPTSLRDA